MAQSSWPFENIDTSETQFSQWARNIGEGVKTGALNELEVFADSTGMQVKIRSGQALVRGHYYQNTSEVTLTLDAASSSNPRIDTVVLELDPSANTIKLVVVTGVAEVGPSAEPVVQTDAGIYQIKLADISVSAGATTIPANNVTDTRFYIEDFSGTVPGSAITGAITNATIPSDSVTGLTANRALISDGSGNVSESAVTSTELSRLDGVTSDVQTQLNGKANLNGANFTGRVTADDATEARFSVRNIYITDNDTPSGGVDGDLWVVWE